MRDLLGWKLSLGRYRGIQVSLHLFFLLFAAFWLYSCARHPNGLLWYGGLGLAILLTSVLLHELGHAWAARRVGGECSEILLVPWGGLAQVELPRWGRDEQAATLSWFIVALAGPLVNFMVCLTMLPLVVAWKIPLSSLLHPLAPPFSLAPGIPLFVSLTFWMNWVLLIFNLLPAFPLDGGRLLRSVLWHWFGNRLSAVWTSRAGQCAGAALFITGIMLPPEYEFANIPLVLMGVFVFISGRAVVSRNAEGTDEDSFLGHDFSQGYTSLDRDRDGKPPEPAPGMVQQWLARRKMARLERERRIEADEELRLDEILARLHEVGRSGLSDEDRRILDRVSARYRSRLQG